MRPLVQILREAHANIDIADGTPDLIVGDYEWQDPVLRANPGIQITLVVPKENDPEQIEQGLMFQFRGPTGFLTDDDLTAIRHLLEHAEKLAEEFNSLISDKAEEVRAKREAEEAERIRKQEEFEATLEERRTILLNEFLGETGRIRAYGSRTFQPVVVSSVEVGDGEFDVEFDWVNDHDYGREKRLHRIRIFDVKIGSRYREVWNDGEEDLSFYEKDQFKRGNVKKYDGEFRF